MRRLLSCLLFLFVVGTWSLAQAAEISQVVVERGLFTGGVIVELDGADGDEQVSVEVRRAQGAFEPAHEAVGFDPSTLAAPIFGLQPGESVDVRLTLDDPNGGGAQSPVVHQLSTRSLQSPAAQRELYVATDGRDEAGAGASGDPFASIQYALDQAEAGDHIRVRAGTYGAISLYGRDLPDGAPIVVRADDPNERPTIAGPGTDSGRAISIADSANLVFDGFEIVDGGTQNDGIGVRIHSSRRVVVKNCYIRDNGQYNVLVTKSAQYSGGITRGGYHIIADNVIADEDHDACDGASNHACPRQTYYGVLLDNNPGAGNIIVRNEMYGHVDNASLGGDEGQARQLGTDTNVLAITGGQWTNHGLEFAHNDLYDARDDHIELDGIAVNARIVANRLGDAENPFSVAPVMPGPNFVVRNIVTGRWGQAAFKLNTAGNSDVPTRNVFVYHNTFSRADAGPMFNLWYAVDGDHNVPISNVVFRNNVFWARAGGRLIDANTNGDEHPSLDYDLWYTPDNQAIFTWPDGAGGRQSFDTFADFQAATGQEADGRFAEPMLDTQTWEPLEHSPVIDAGLVIAGINDDFTGAAPDLGAVPFVPEGGPADAGGGSDAGDGDDAGSGSDAGGGDDGGDELDTGDVSNPGDAATDDAGQSGEADGSTQESASGDSGGCGCRTGGTMPGSAIVLLLAALGVLAKRRRAVGE